MAELESDALLRDVRNLLTYNRETGEFRWAAKPGRRIVLGSIAGCSKKGGYRCIQVSGRLILAHRLAWVCVYGVWPLGMLDHINGDPSDNRIENLRVASCSQNQANSKRRADNTSGYKGVTWHAARNRWSARIKRSGSYVSLGYYDTAEAAHDAYVRGARAFFGEFANAG